MSNYKSYFLKSLGLKEDAVLGSNGKLKPAQGPDEEQLKLGIKTEAAHTQDEGLAKQIANKHLNEDPTYYSTLKEAGIPDEGEESEAPKISKLAPKVRCPQVIGVAVRGTKTGLLPAGGIVEDPERARLGGFELVQNKKPNSQGAIANTPASSEIKADGGHYTPENSKISKGKGPKTSKEGDDSIHPHQTQQLGNKPFEDDGTTRDGESTPEAAGGNGGDGRCSDAKSSASTASDRQDYKSNKSDDSETEPEPEPETDSKPDDSDNDGDDDGDGEDVEIDIAEKKEDSDKEEKKDDKKESLQERFQKLANIPKTGQETTISKSGILERIVEAIVKQKRTFDTPASVTRTILSEITKKGIKGYEKKQDYILSKVHECWK